ncbi:MAG: spore gernimation protein [Symbiobacteriaceae bacterium]|jgi:spore germination protein KB|nr:spore gernimation protein [Symbiobacteriaceae bacterium]
MKQKAKVKIGALQLITIFASLIFGKAIGFTNGGLARTVGRDAWASMTVALLTGMLLLPAIVWLARRGGGPLIAYIKRLLGRWLGGLVLLLFAVYFGFAFATSANTMTLHISDYLMTETPFAVFVVGYTLLVTYGVYLGLEVAARLSVLGLIMTGLLTISMMAGSFDKFNYTQMLPMFDHGVLPVLAASSIAHTDVAMVAAAALALLPHSVGPPGRWNRLCWWGLGTGGILVLVWSIFETAVLGPDVVAQYLIACMQMARAAELSIYLHRYEMIMVVLFAYGVVTQSVVTLYCAVTLTEGALPWRVPRGWLILGWAALTVPLQFLLGNDRDRYGIFLETVWPAASIALAYGLPLFLCLVALLRPAAAAQGSTKSG